MAITWVYACPAYREPLLQSADTGGGFRLGCGHPLQPYAYRLDGRLIWGKASASVTYQYPYPNGVVL